MKSPLIVNGIDLEKEGVKIISLPPFQLSTKRVNDIDIQGRDGTLTEYDGYTSDSKTVEADYKGNNQVKLLNILESSNEVIFGNIPDRYYKCRLDNQIPLSQIIENQLYNFLIVFKCQPFGYLLSGKNIIELVQQIPIDNPGTYKSLPLITVYGTGACTLIVNGTSYPITNIYGAISLDSDIEEVLNNKGEYFESDYFPELQVGENIISWIGSGVTKVEITPRWRCL